MENRVVLSKARPPAWCGEPCNSYVRMRERSHTGEGAGRWGVPIPQFP